MKPLLSMCLPTYNRERFLARFLCELQKEIEGIEDRIELNISDNASTDCTEQLVKSVKEIIGEKLKINYTRNKKNIGFDKNLLSVLNMANGKYCWTVGDDDVFVKGSVKKLVELLENSDEDYLILNANKHGKLLFADVPTYTTYSFIGCHVIKKVFFDRIKAHLPKSSFGFMHLSIFIVSRSKGCSLKIIKDTFVDIRGDGTILSAVPLVSILYRLQRLIYHLYVVEKAMSREQYLELSTQLYSNRLMYYLGSLLASRSTEEIEECYNIIQEINFSFCTKNKDRFVSLINFLYKNKIILSVCRQLFRLYITLLKRYQTDDRTTARETDF